jgi:hypothetical protein
MYANLAERISENSQSQSNNICFYKRFLDKQYDIKKGADGTFMIGNATLSVENESNITIYDKQYTSTRGLWEPLTRKNVKKDIVTTRDMKASLRKSSLNYFQRAVGVKQNHSYVSSGSATDKI